MSRPLPKQAILIVNAMSRKGADAFAAARDKLADAGVELIEAHAVDKPDGMEAAVKAAIGKAPMVIIGGGDGSISSNIGHFIGTDAVVGILPLGTANSFAKSLGIGDELDDAVAVIANGRRRTIDLGRIDEHYFANAAAIGLSPLIADSVPHGLKRWLGMAGYLIWAIRVAFKYRPFRMRLTLDNGETAERWATEIRIANGSHHGGVELVEHAAVDSGSIIVQAVTGKSLWGLAWSWFATLFKLSGRERTTEEWKGRKMTLETRPRQKVSVDGEIECRTPSEIEIARSAIEVAAPRA